MADKVFGQDFTNITSPTGTETISVLQSGTMKDVALTDVLSGVTHNATTKATPVDADELPISDSAATNSLKKLTWANLKATLNAVYDWATVTHAATGKTTPVDADELSIVDSAASNVIKKLTWANLKATLNSIYDWATVAHAATGKTTPVDADELSIVDSAASNVIKKLTWANLKATLNAVYDWATVAHAATGKTTPVDADELSIVDSAASNVIKKLTWANLKATLLAYFDAFYPRTTGWTEVTDTWTYASATTITVPSDATTKYPQGVKIRLKQGGSYKYFYGTTVAATLITINGGSDYTLTNASITNVAFSMSENPLGFPNWMNYTVTWSRAGTPFTNNPTTNTAQFKLIGNMVLGYIDFTMPASAGGTGEVYASTPITVVTDRTDFGLETAVTAKFCVTIAVSSINKLNFYNDTPAVILTTSGYTYKMNFKYLI